MEFFSRVYSDSNCCRLLANLVESPIPCRCRLRSCSLAFLFKLIWFCTPAIFSLTISSVLASFLASLANSANPWLDSTALAMRLPWRLVFKTIAYSNILFKDLYLLTGFIYNKIKRGDLYVDDTRIIYYLLFCLCCF